MVRCNVDTVIGYLRNNALLVATGFGILSGLLLGLALQGSVSREYVPVIAYPGEIFIRALQMTILPLVITSLITGSTSLNAKTNGKIALRTLIYFLLTSLLSGILGVLLAVIIRPGRGITERYGESDSSNMNGTGVLNSFLDLGRNIVPGNIFSALFKQTQTVIVTNAEGFKTKPVSKLRDGTNMLGVIFFTLIFGTVLGTYEERAKSLLESIRLVEEVIMTIVRGVMWLTPIGVASLIAAKIIASDGHVSGLFEKVGLFLATVLIGVLIYQLFVYQLIYLVVKRRNPFKFYVGLMQANLTAFATASSAVTLPVTFRCLDGLKIDSRISRFVVPIGITVNMDGTALFVSVASIFIAQMNDMSLGIGNYITVAIVATMVSVAVASVPSGALALVAIVLNSIGVPSADILLLSAVDWLADRLRTTNNVIGDCYAAAILEHFSSVELLTMGRYQKNAASGVALARIKEGVGNKMESGDEERRINAV